MSAHRNTKDRSSNDVVICGAYQNTVIDSSLDKALFNLKYKYSKDVGNRGSCYCFPCLMHHWFLTKSWLEASWAEGNVPRLCRGQARDGVELWEPLCSTQTLLMDGPCLGQALHWPQGLQLLRPQSCLSSDFLKAWGVIGKRSW